ncbi:MAG: AMP-binding protein [Deferribacterota bacterium]|nr:AMP-binding protein [Deferribacterota bacterium]
MHNNRYTYDISKFKNLFERNFIYIKAFERSVFKYPEKIALIDANKDIYYTYRELNNEVNKLANAMKRWGASFNDVIVYMLMNCPEFAFIYLAAQKISCVNSPINFRFSPGELAYVLNDSKPIFLFIDYTLKDTAYKALSESAYKPKLIVVVDCKKDEKLERPFISYEEFVDGASIEEPKNQRQFDAYSEVTRLYTSGTTGMPKGVIFNNINEVLSAQSVIMCLKNNFNDVHLNISPWFHRGGLYLSGPIPPFYIGATIVSMKYFHPRSTLDYIEKYRVTQIVAVPSMYVALLNEQKKLKKDVSSVNVILTMGAPLERDLCLELIDVFTNKIYNACGTTETLLNELLTPEDLPARAGQTGRAAMDDDVRVVKVCKDKLADPDELVAKDSKEVGEIVVNTLKGSLCYFNNEEEERKRVKGDWFYTGDLAVWDKDGYITIKSRKDDMIIVGGNNIYPAHIEEIINRHPLVEDVAIVGAPDKKRGQIIVAYVVKKDDSLDEKELRLYVNSSTLLSPQERPRYYIFVKELPRTATGKKQHYKLRAALKNDLKDISD